MDLGCQLTNIFLLTKQEIMKVSSVAVIAACAAVAVEGADVAVLKQKIQAIVDDCKGMQLLDESFRVLSTIVPK